MALVNVDSNETEIAVTNHYSDFADTDAVATAVRGLAERAGGKVHGVFTAAGFDSCGKLGDVTTKDWERVIHVYLLGTAAVIVRCCPF